MSRWGHAGKPHLWIVITSQFGDPARVGVVNVCTWRRHADDTVILDVGDHPFITHKSYIYYSGLRVEPVRDIVEKVKGGLGEWREQVSDELLVRIQDGLRASPFAVVALREQCLPALF